MPAPVEPSSPINTLKIACYALTLVKESETYDGVNEAMDIVGCSRWPLEAKTVEHLSRDLLGSGSLLGFQIIPDACYDFGYVNNGMMTMPAMALILVGCVIWVHRAYFYKEK